MDLDPDRHPFGGERYGEYPDSEQESEDPEVDLEPEPASGSGVVRSCELQGGEQGEEPPEDQPAELPGEEDQGWQLPVSVRGRGEEDLLLPRPEVHPPELPEELPELNLQLEQLFPGEPLPPELLQGEE